MRDEKGEGADIQGPVLRGRGRLEGASNARGTIHSRIYVGVGRGGIFVISLTGHHCPTCSFSSSTSSFSMRHFLCCWLTTVCEEVPTA